MLDYDRIAATPAVHDPFSHFTVENLLDRTSLAALTEDFPFVLGPGLFPPTDLSYGPSFAKLIEEIAQPRLRLLMEEKFDLDLSDKPLMITVRGFCQKKDGRIHVDSTDKLVTCLLYLNKPYWGEQGGRLRLLRGPYSLDDAIAEIPPNGGTLVAFRRSDQSWHGHEPYEGERRAIMFNWMKSEAVLRKNLLRHKLSSFAKSFGLAAGY
ncbi:MAG TPA: 2OG-Fe(II) oxygenase [Magnetospirillaceae bacterium]|nr:2OG-Fe(II) oxygenase [Magnetospirillaceae bacterium]